MTRIQLFYSRAYPGNTLRANTLQALAHLGVNPEMQAEETVPEQIGTPLPALAIDGEIVVYGVEPSVRELELLLQDPSPGAGGGFSLRRVRHGMQRHERPGKLPHVHPGRERRQHGGQNHRLCHPAHAPVPRDENPVLNCPGSSHAGLPLFTYPSFLFQEMKIHGS
ncbi:hypothetical protein [Akkermansia muciniphila]|uniref:hypothetical protein n=1 Tax=Akkermansia muciniphila TaxID=239935 RepID=UPI0030D1BE6B